MIWKFIPDNKKQALRLKRHLISSVAVLLYSLVGVYFYSRDSFILDGSTVLIAFIMLWLGQLIFAIIIRTGLNLKFSDPSLTHAQMIWATIFLLIFAYALKDQRYIMLTAYLAILSFGFFRLKPKQFIFNTALTLSAYLCIIVYIYINEPLRIRIENEFVQLAVFSVTCIILVYTGSAVSRLRDLHNEKTTELENALHLNQLLAITDDLTGLHTRSHLMDILSQQKALVDRENGDFLILFADLDHFKSINDTYGHQTGDVVLEKFSDIIHRSIREVDYAARFGGEEFVIVLANTDMENAKNIAERIRETIERYNFNDVAPGLRVTVSIGVSSFQQFKSIQETLQNADDRMYKAKQAGRNICVYED